MRADVPEPWLVYATTFHVNRGLVGPPRGVRRCAASFPSHSVFWTSPFKPASTSRHIIGLPRSPSSRSPSTSPYLHIPLLPYILPTRPVYTCYYFSRLPICESSVRTDARHKGFILLAITTATSNSPTTPRPLPLVCSVALCCRYRLSESAGTGAPGINVCRNSLTSYSQKGSAGWGTRSRLYVDAVFNRVAFDLPAQLRVGQSAHPWIPPRPPQSVLPGSYRVPPGHGPLECTHRRRIGPISHPSRPVHLQVHARTSDW